MFEINTRKYGTVYGAFAVKNGVGQVYTTVYGELSGVKEVTDFVKMIHRHAQGKIPHEIVSKDTVQHFVMDDNSLYVRTVNFKDEVNPYTYIETLEEDIEKDFSMLRLDEVMNEEESEATYYDVIEAPGDDIKAFELEEVLNDILDRIDATEVESETLLKEYLQPNLSNRKLAEKLGVCRKRVDRGIRSARRKINDYFEKYPEEKAALIEGRYEDMKYKGSTAGSVTGPNVRELLQRTFPYAHGIYEVLSKRSDITHKILKFHHPDQLEKGGYTIYGVRVSKIKDGDNYGIKVITSGEHFRPHQYYNFKNQNAYKLI